MANKVVDWFLDKPWQRWRFEWWWCVVRLAVFAISVFALTWWWATKSGVSEVQPVQSTQMVGTPSPPLRESEQIFVAMKQRIKVLGEQVERQRVQLELAKHELAQFRTGQPVDMKSEREVTREAKSVLGDFGLRDITVVRR